MGWLCAGGEGPGLGLGCHCAVKYRLPAPHFVGEFWPWQPMPMAKSESSLSFGCGGKDAWDQRMLERGHSGRCAVAHGASNATGYLAGLTGQVPAEAKACPILVGASRVHPRSLQAVLVVGALIVIARGGVGSISVKQVLKRFLAHVSGADVSSTVEEISRADVVATKPVPERRHWIDQGCGQKRGRPAGGILVGFMMSARAVTEI